MSFDDHDSHGPAGQAPRALGARRDLLGLAALLGPDSGLVPISDLDAGTEWLGSCGSGAGSHDHAGVSGFGAAGAVDGPGAGDAARGALPNACGSCSTRCATVELALGRVDTCDTEQHS